MSATLTRPTGRGRQASEVEQLRDVREELHAERCEGTALASLCLESANRIHVAAAADREDIVLDQAGRIGVAAGRFLAQRS